MKRKSSSLQLRGILLFLSCLMLSAAVIRLGLGISAAQAIPASDAPEPVPAICPTPPAALMDALKQREERVAVQEAAALERDATLALAQDIVALRLQELVAAEEKLAATLAQADGAAEGDVLRLTAVYEAMKPADAAALFETMAPEFASGFLGRMRPDAAAAVMSGLKSETAYAISVLLAGRNALAPTQ